MPTPQRQIPPERKFVYYLGMVLMIVGFLTFGSVFVSGIAHFGDFSNFDGRAKSMGVRAITGMAMLMAGGVLMGIGRMGMAGSGIKLDPEQTRRDVEPWARTGGGVLKDALDEAGITFGNSPSSEPPLPYDERLRRLKKLKDDGLISEQEYEATKKKILESA